MTSRRVAALFALAAVAPLLFEPSGDVLNNLVLAAAYVVMALGLNVIVGFAGLLDLGYVAFYAIGAYTAAYFGSSYWSSAGADGIHINFILILVIAVAATAVAGALIGVPTLRVGGDYIAIVTLAFGEIIGQIVANGRDIELFGGTLTSGPISFGPVDPIDLPGLAPFGSADLRPWYWFALGLVALALVVNLNLRRSRFGRAWRALRDDETAAAFCGVSIARTKLAAYATGAALGGMSGAFLASYRGFVDATQFEFSFSILIFAMVVIGGLGSLTGVVIGAILLSLLNNYILPGVLPGLPIKPGVYGAVLVLVILLRPQGLVPAAHASRSAKDATRTGWLRRRSARAAPLPW